MSSQPYLSLPSAINRQTNSFHSQPNALSRDRSRSRSPGIAASTQGNMNAHSQTIKKMMEDISMYPAGFAQLLRHQNRNLKTFKLNINKQKQRIDQDMKQFKLSLNHTLEDLRLSLHAHLDRVYQGYLEKASKFRGELFDLHRIKQQLDIQLGTASMAQLQAKIRLSSQKINPIYSNIPQKDGDKELPNPNNSRYISPKLNTKVALQAQTNQTISSMQAGNSELKKYYILNYITDIQKQRMVPLNELQQELVTLNNYQNGFYQSKQFQATLDRLRDIIGREVRRIYDNSFLYIRDIEPIVLKQKQLQANNNRVLDALELNQPVGNSGVWQEVGSGNNINRLGRIYGANLHGVISPSEQSLRVNVTQNINILQQPINIQLPSGLGFQTALCGIFINNQIALGLKDGIIQIFSCDGHNIATLKQHRTNICTLAVIHTKNQNYLASGSDVGCCKVIIWEPVTWQPKFIFNAHVTAVTGIVDLQDETHILSAGYDKKLNIYNLQQGKQVASGPQSESPIIALLINKTGTKIVTCGLDKAIYVYAILRDHRMKFQNIVLERKMQNNTVICAIVVSQIVPQLVVMATKDGKIKLVNIDKGESYKTIVFHNLIEEQGLGSAITAYPLEITIIERDSKPYYPIAIVWPHKQKKLYQVNTDTTLVSIKNLSTGGGMLQYGYGVNPKCFYVPDSSKGSLIYSVNQKINTSSLGNSNNCVTVFKVQDLR